MTKYITTLVLALTLLSANAQTSNMMNDSKLTTRQINLATCAALEAQGDMERLDKALRKALDEGVTVNELKEAFSQLYAYTGFPRSLNALNLLKTVLEERKSSGIDDNEGKPWQRPALWDNAEEALLRGTEVQTRLCGGVPYNLNSLHRTTIISKHISSATSLPVTNCRSQTVRLSPWQPSLP